MSGERANNSGGTTGSGSRSAFTLKVEMVNAAIAFARSERTGKQLAKSLSSLASTLSESCSSLLAQVWLPEREDDTGRLVLTTKNLPFSVLGSGDQLALYRCYSCKYKFETDVGTRSEQLGAPGRVFLTGEPEMTHNVQVYSSDTFKRVDDARKCKIFSTIVMPLYSPDNQYNHPFGVVEACSLNRDVSFELVMEAMEESLKSCGMATADVNRIAVHTTLRMLPPVEISTSAGDGADSNSSNSEQGGGGAVPASDASMKPMPVAAGGDAMHGRRTSEGETGTAPKPGPGRGGLVNVVAQGGAAAAHAMPPPPPGPGPKADPGNLNRTSGSRPTEANEGGAGPGAGALGDFGVSGAGAAAAAAAGLPGGHQQLQAALMQLQQLQQQQGANGMPNASQLGAMLPQLQLLAQAGLLGLSQAQANPSQAQAVLLAAAAAQAQSQQQALLALLQASNNQAGQQSSGAAAGPHSLPMAIPGLAGMGGQGGAGGFPGAAAAAAAGGQRQAAPPMAMAMGMGGMGQGNGSPTDDMMDLGDLVYPRKNQGQGRKLTIEDLQSHFNVGLKEAAARLGICPTTLKRACRRFGIQRWPRRAIARMQRQMSSGNVAGINNGGSGAGGAPGSHGSGGLAGSLQGPPAPAPGPHFFDMGPGGLPMPPGSLPPLGATLMDLDEDDFNPGDDGRRSAPPLDVLSVQGLHGAPELLSLFAGGDDFDLDDLDTLDGTTDLSLALPGQ